MLPPWGPKCHPCPRAKVSPMSRVIHFDGDTFRTVYTVRFAEAVYVLHAFQKKSKRAIQTPKHVIDLVQQRYEAARRHHVARASADKETER